MPAHLAISPIERAVADIAAGRMVILVDDEDRENEGDLVIAAERVSADAIAFMAEHGRGLICLALHPPLVDRLELAPMAPHNEARLGTAFTVSIDAVDAPGSGVSARARAHTIARAIAPDATARDFRVPGHIYPLRARAGGVLVRSGQTEGSVDLARLAGLAPAGVICEVMGSDGEMSRLPTLLEFGATHNIAVVTVADLIEYRLQREPLVVREAESELSTDFGPFRIVIFRSLVDGGTHAALVCGDISGDAPVIVRVHRSNPLGDVFGFTLSRGQRSLGQAMQSIAAAGRGVLLYLEAERDGGELADALATYIERGEGRPWPPPHSVTAKMDFQEFGTGAQILRALGLRKLRVMTNQPKRLRAVSGFGLEIVQWLPVGAAGKS
ncbi:MAG: 3,4-dihydroxy-2-butanone-4-phosphate synthase [Myxococcales bacterium]|nr:3,4-dihydroxy-2-butanone-4-phosphate synthase [Myxococcales bacterium]